MAISPWPAGQTQPLQVTLLDTTGAVPPLTNGTPSLLIVNARTRTQVAGTGTFSTINTTTGQVTYTWGAGETLNAGVYRLYVVVTFPSGATRYFGPVYWEVTL